MTSYTALVILFCYSEFYYFKYITYNTITGKKWQEAEEECTMRSFIAPSNITRVRKMR
jgi:hypothetical protein